jgi:hypothetical protein
VPYLADYHLSHVGGEFFLSEKNREKCKDMTVAEAGHMGGQKVKRLIKKGKEHEKD